MCHESGAGLRSERGDREVHYPRKETRDGRHLNVSWPSLDIEVEGVTKCAHQWCYSRKVICDGPVGPLPQIFSIRRVTTFEVAVKALWNH